MSFILITGSRSITNKIGVERILAESITKDDVVIHGGAPGVDTIAEDYCKRHNIKNKRIRPVKSEKIYYLHRNAEMIGMVDIVIGFHDGVSKGCAFTLEYARLRGKIVKKYNMQKLGEA